MPTCLLVRHGRTSANASGTLAGWTPGVELDETGVRQVSDLAGRVVDLPVVALASSPLTRCLATADVLRAQAWPGLVVAEEVDLGECRYGAWTGRPLAELATDPLWSVVQGQPSAARFPDSPEHSSESLAQMSARAIAAVRALDARVEAEHGPHALWAAVSHGDVIKAVLADAAGSHLDHFQRFVVGPASVSVVRYTTERPYLVRVNDTGSDLGALRPPPPSTDAAHEGPPGVSGGAGVVGGGV